MIGCNKTGARSVSVNVLYFLDGFRKLEFWTTVHWGPEFAFRSLRVGFVVDVRVSG